MTKQKNTDNAYRFGSNQIGSPFNMHPGKCTANSKVYDIGYVDIVPK